MRNTKLSPLSLRETINSFQKSRIILTGYELGVFTVLGDKSKTSLEVSRKIKANHRATDRLMNALCAVRFLKKKNNKFFNTPFSARYLVKGKPGYLTGLMHSVNQWNSWTTLTDAVRKGASVMEYDDDDDTEWLAGFIGAMHERAYKTAPAVVALLDLKNVRRVLDVGGGSGIYSMALVRANKNITATVFDLPEVVPITKKYIKKEKLTDSINTIAGDFTADKLGAGFDLVLLSAIVHSISPKENIKLISKCAWALNPNGQIVIQDFIINADRITPAHGAVFALNMLVNTEAGDTYTESEVRQWLKQTGFAGIKRRNTPFNASLIIARKK